MNDDARMESRVSKQKGSSKNVPDNGKHGCVRARRSRLQRVSGRLLRVPRVVASLAKEKLRKIVILVLLYKKIHHARTLRHRR